jgi:nucleoside-diphosphate-sugar epimerase
MNRDARRVSDGGSTPERVEFDPGLHVVLGTGQVGTAVARLLGTGDADLRVVNRSGAVPADLRRAGEVISADASDPDAARAACGGASVVYFCLQPPYDRWPELFPALLDGALAGAAAADATFVMADNLYAYGPVDGEITEDCEYGATGERGRTRAEMARSVLSAHEAGRVRTTIGRASDFYGPGVTESIVGRRVFRGVLDGGTVWYPGDPGLPHTYTYVGDFARALLALGTHEAALGEAWHVPSAETLTTREFVKLAGDVAGTDPIVRHLPSWVVKPLGLASTTLGQLAETQSQRTNPYVVSHEKFAAAFDLEPTPHREAIRRTLDWYRTTA